MERIDLSDLNGKDSNFHNQVLMRLVHKDNEIVDWISEMENVIYELSCKVTGHKSINSPGEVKPSEEGKGLSKKFEEYKYLLSDNMHEELAQIAKEHYLRVVDEVIDKLNNSNVSVNLLAHNTIRKAIQQA